MNLQCPTARVQYVRHDEGKIVIPWSNYQIPEWLARSWRICSLSRRSWVSPTHYAVAAAESMRVALTIVGLALIVFGGIWFLQRINVLTGSFMTGQIRWAIYGGIAVAGGISILVALRDR